MLATSPVRRRQAGFSLVELGVTLSVSLALLSQALPALHGLRGQQRLSLVAQSVAEDLHWARSEAIAKSESVVVGFGGTQATQCYVIHTGRSGDCSCEADGQAICRPEAQLLRAQWAPAQSGIRFRSNATSLHIEPRRGLVTSTATVEIADDQGRRVKQIVAITGRVRGCSPAGSVPGWKACA